MADVTLLWFQCKNPDCNYVPIKTKKDKVKRYWKHGLSLQESKRARLFMRYAEGYYKFSQNGDIWFISKYYGSILMYDHNQEQPTNSYHYPIKDIELCQPCERMIKNEGALFQ